MSKLFVRMQIVGICRVLFISCLHFAVPEDRIDNPNFENLGWSLETVLQNVCQRRRSVIIA